MQTSRVAMGSKKAMVQCLIDKEFSAEESDPYASEEEGQRDSDHASLASPSDADQQDPASCIHSTTPAGPSMEAPPLQVTVQPTLQSTLPPSTQEHLQQMRAMAVSCDKEKETFFGGREGVSHLLPPPYTNDVMHMRQADTSHLDEHNPSTMYHCVPTYLTGMLFA